MPITFEEAKELRIGQTLYHKAQRDADGSPSRWRVNGKVKLWKRSPNIIQVPLKRGLYQHDYLTEAVVEAGALCLTEEEAMGGEDQ